MGLPASEIAEVCQGRWYGPELSLPVQSFSYLLKQVQAGDLFIVRSAADFPELGQGHQNKSRQALARGAIALLVSAEADIVEGTPCLLVDDCKQAFLALAQYLSKQSSARRILVTGSYGKTGFKVRLGQLIGSQCSTSVINNSANEDSGVFRALCAIRPEDAVAIIEVSGSNGKRILRRAEAVQPDFTIITSIGHEHIHRHGSISTAIHRKTSVTRFLSPGGYCLLPAGRYLNALQKAALEHNPNCRIEIFGDHPDSAARIISKEFDDYGWQVTANIADSILSYRVPFVEEHSVEASLAELLTIQLLGLDVRKAADQYGQLTQFESSGQLYRVELDGREFVLYDQSKRGGIEGYESFFKTLRYLEPDSGGKKIVLTSAYVDSEDNELDNIEGHRFAELTCHSNIDAFFTVEHFADQKDVLPDKSLLLSKGFSSEKSTWVLHRNRCVDLYPLLVPYLRSGDLLAVKGIFESELSGFLVYLKEQGANVTRLYSKGGGVKTDPPSKWLDYRDLSRFKAILSEDARQWCAFFPFLYFFSRQARMRLSLETLGQVQTLLLYRNYGRNNQNIELYLPPFISESGKDSLEQIREVQTILYDRNKVRRSNILWLTDEERLRLGSSFRYLKKQPEYLFSPARVLKLEGSALSNLRYNLKRFSKAYPDAEVTPYHLNDFYECLKLLKHWHSSKALDETSDDFYTLECLRNADLFSAPDLVGYTVRIEGKIRAFGFAGEISSQAACLFIAKADPAVRGLNYFLKYELIKSFADYQWINDASDLGSEGLRKAKESFDPVEQLQIFKARDGY